MKIAAAVLSALFGLALLLLTVFRLLTLANALDPAAYRPEEIPEGFTLLSESQHTWWDQSVLVFHYERPGPGGHVAYFNLRVVSSPFRGVQAAALSEGEGSGVWIEGLPVGRFSDGEGTHRPDQVNLLSWEEGGVSLSLQSNALDQSAMLRVGESVRGRDGVISPIILKEK